MNNFFDEYLYKKEEYEVLQKAYSGAFEVVRAHVEDIARNTVISKTSTFKRIRFQMIDVSSAMYTMSALLNNTSVLAIMGLAQSTPYDQKLSTWNNLLPSEKMDILDVTGYSVLLSSFSSMRNGDEYSPAKFNIVDFKLSDINNNHYIRNVDYAFKDNKLFILKEFSVSDSSVKKTLIMKDIVIDTNTTEDILGTQLNIPYNDQFTKTEYNETMRSFIQAAAGGATLKNLNFALARYKTLQGVRVYDKYSAPPSKKSFWGFDGHIGELTAFDFLVALPLTFAYNSDKLDYISKFFNQIKPAYTNFTFIPQKDIVDKLILKYKKDTPKIKPICAVPDKIKSGETGRYKVVQALVENYALTLQGISDLDDHYDTGVIHDMFTLHDHQKMDTTTSFNDLLRSSDTPKVKPIVFSREKIVASDANMQKQKAISRMADIISVKVDSSAKVIDGSIIDRIKYLDKLHLLNKHICYDKIVVSKDAIINKYSHRAIDTLKSSKYTNTVYCDGEFSYDDVGGLFCDSDEDTNTKSRESVTMRLIPK